MYYYCKYTISSELVSVGGTVINTKRTVHVYILWVMAVIIGDIKMKIIPLLSPWRHNNIILLLSECFISFSQWIFVLKLKQQLTITTIPYYHYTIILLMLPLNHLSLLPLVHVRNSEKCLLHTWLQYYSHQSLHY